MRKQEPNFKILLLILFLASGSGEAFGQSNPNFEGDHSVDSPHKETTLVENAPVNHTTLENSYVSQLSDNIVELSREGLKSETFIEKAEKLESIAEHLIALKFAVFTLEAHFNGKNVKSEDDNTVEKLNELKPLRRVATLSSIDGYNAHMGPSDLPILSVKALQSRFQELSNSPSALSLKRLRDKPDERRKARDSIVNEADRRFQEVLNWLGESKS